MWLCLNLMLPWHQHVNCVLHALTSCRYCLYIDMFLCTCTRYITLLDKSRVYLCSSRQMLIMQNVWRNAMHFGARPGNQNWLIAADFRSICLYTCAQTTWFCHNGMDCDINYMIQQTHTHSHTHIYIYTCILKVVPFFGLFLKRRLWKIRGRSQWVEAFLCFYHFSPIKTPQIGFCCKKCR